MYIVYMILAIHQNCTQYTIEYREEGKKKEFWTFQNREGLSQDQKVGQRGQTFFWHSVVVIVFTFDPISVWYFTTRMQGVEVHPTVTCKHFPFILAQIARSKLVSKAQYSASQISSIF